MQNACEYYFIQTDIKWEYINIHKVLCYAKCDVWMLWGPFVENEKAAVLGCFGLLAFEKVDTYYFI